MSCHIVRSSGGEDNKHPLGQPPSFCANGLKCFSNFNHEVRLVCPPRDQRNIATNPGPFSSDVWSVLVAISIIFLYFSLTRPHLSHLSHLSPLSLSLSLSYSLTLLLSYLSYLSHISHLSLSSLSHLSHLSSRSSLSSLLSPVLSTIRDDVM